jgi:hypothetical protein
MSIKVDNGSDGSVPGFLHLPPTQSFTPTSKTAAILLSGAGGGVVGPSSIYLSLADKLASLNDQPLPVLRMDCRYPARNKYCVRDVSAAVNELEATYKIEKFASWNGHLVARQFSRPADKIPELLGVQQSPVKPPRPRGCLNSLRGRCYCCMGRVIGR